MERLTIFHGTRNGQLIDIDIQLLAQSMGSIEGLVLETAHQRTILLGRNIWIRAYAGFHHRSIRITLLHAVRLRPYLSALIRVVREGLTGTTSLERNEDNLDIRIILDLVQRFLALIIPH